MFIGNFFKEYIPVFWFHSDRLIKKKLTDRVGSVGSDN
ncbi:hypothetical protein CWATWH0003_4215 [Crocosphaera watsonii WH 0003]|uniref:Uncharacterized protein n=1 Tax=Crocosphaera watsonii WH 0003 TaxID=423471 RepID=G5J9V2_CROWT|nr:hypothetical protein CWATWH0003_4215 [Crocosphaera watsonii WH 0003]